MKIKETTIPQVNVPRHPVISPIPVLRISRKVSSIHRIVHIRHRASQNRGNVREDRRGRTEDEIEIYKCGFRRSYLEESAEFIFCLWRSLRSVDPSSSFSFYYPSLLFPPFFSFSLSLSHLPRFPLFDRRNPSVSYYSPVVRARAPLYATDKAPRGRALPSYPSEIFGNIRMNGRPVRLPGRVETAVGLR